MNNDKIKFDVEIQAELRVCRATRVLRKNGTLFEMVSEAISYLQQHYGVLLEVHGKSVWLETMRDLDLYIQGYNDGLKSAAILAEYYENKWNKSEQFTVLENNTAINRTNNDKANDNAIPAPAPVPAPVQENTPVK